MKRGFNQVPVETDVMIPLRPLTELAAHKQEFFPRMAKHKPVKEAQIRKLLPFITRHLVEHRPFPVDHFIMGKGEDEILAERIHQAERYLVMVIAAKNRIG